MREIKFRAWQVVREKGAMKYNLIPGDNYEDRFGGELMQFTGLTDKNGKEIYEGDIVKIKDGSQEGNYEVCWQQEYSRFGVRGLSSYLPKLVDAYDGFEVIGNIYENPELLTP